MDCSNAQILLNNTPEFWMIDGDGLYHEGYYNNNDEDYGHLKNVVSNEQIDPSYNSQVTTTQYFGINLCDVLTHELGHCYGFDDNYLCIYVRQKA